VGLARISAVATIAGRIPAATVVVAVSVAAAAVAVVDAPADQAALAICRRRNMLRRKVLKATTPAGILVAMTSVPKARIVALNPAVSSHADSAALKIAALRHHARAVPPRPLRILTLLKNRSCSPVSP
jgi:hypothetical protein